MACRLDGTTPLSEQMLEYCAKKKTTAKRYVSDWFVQVPLCPSGLGVGLWNQ